MGDSFYAKWTHLFDAKNITAWDDILWQYMLIDSHTRNYTSNLLVHGWSDPPAKWADAEGKAPHVWGRAVGWYFMSLLETLQVFPKWHAGYGLLLHYFQQLTDGVQRAQDETSGGWWQVMDEPYPGMKGNYIEASGSAMFTYSLLKGVHLGYIDKHRYLKTAKKAYEGLVKSFIRVEDDVVHYIGTVQECGLAVADPSFEVSFSHFLINYVLTKPVLHQRQDCCRRLQGIWPLYACSLRMGDLGQGFLDKINFSVAICY